MHEATSSAVKRTVVEVVSAARASIAFDKFSESIIHLLWHERSHCMSPWAGHLDCAKLLLKYKADGMWTSPQGWTLLHLAAW